MQVKKHTISGADLSLKEEFVKLIHRFLDVCSLEQPRLSKVVRMPLAIGPFRIFSDLLKAKSWVVPKRELTGATAVTPTGSSLS